MARKLSSSHLKLHVDDSDHPTQKMIVGPSSQFDLSELLSAFSNATGWHARPLNNTPQHGVGMDSQEGTPTRDLRPLRERMQLVSTAPVDGLLEVDLGEPVTSEGEAWHLLQQIDVLVQQLSDAEQAIRRQEAQLASAVGVSIRKDESELLAARMQESLQRAMEQSGSDAAAVYLLDDATRELKMRNCWGLPVSALAGPARPLQGSLADLEALMGNAVLVENTALAPEWNCPENFTAALCLPIGSPTMPQGTLWLWSNHVRDFDQTDIAAGQAASDKILADIERSVLADEVLKTRALDRQIEAASLVQSSRLPSLQPLHADYEIGGWTFQGQSLGGNFHTWTINQHGRICAALGAAATSAAAGALVATAVQTVVETCWNSRHKPSQILRKANDILWAAEDGDWRSSVCHLQLHAASGSTELALAGTIGAFLIGPRGFRPINGTTTHLAEQPDTAFRNEQIYLEGGELLLIASANVLSGESRGGFSQGALLEMVRTMQEDAVEDIAGQLARTLPMGLADDSCPHDRSLMIIRRRF